MSHGRNGSLKDAEEIIFAPDKYLTHYVSTQTGRNFVYWHGYCPTHVRILAKDIIEKKKLHPKAEAIVHPECTPEVIKLADKVLSTEGMCKYAKISKAKELIVGTETGLVYRLRKENPDKLFYPVSGEAICPNMKLSTLEKVLWALEDMNYEATLPEDVIARAQGSIKRMLDYIE